MSVEEKKNSPFQIITGYCFIGFSVIILLALISFTPSDSSLFVSQVNFPTENIAGGLGIFFSSWIVLLYGKYAGLVLSFAVFTLGINILISAKIGRVLIKMSLFVMTTMSLSVLLALTVSSPNYIDCGLIGVIIEESLSELIPDYVLISIFSLIIILSLSATMKLFRSIAGFFAKAIIFIFVAPFKLLSGKDGVEEIPGEAPDLDNNPSVYYPASKNQSARPVSEFDNEYEEGDEGEEKNESLNEWPIDDVSDEQIVHDDSVPEPSFLRNYEEEESDNEQPMRIKTREKSPGWLNDEDNSGGVIESIDEYFDKMIYGDEDESEISLPNEPVTESNDDILETLPAHPEKAEVDIETVQDQLEEIVDTQEEVIAPVIDEGEDEEITDTASEWNQLSEKHPVKIEIEEQQEENESDDEIIVTYEDSEDEITAENENLIKKPDFESNYHFPSTSVLDQSFETFTPEEELTEIKRIIEIIESTFESFKISITVSGYSRGPAITRYEIVPPEGLKLKSIVNLTDDLALKLGTRNIRIVAPIGNKSLIGVEVPNRYRKNIVLRDIIESKEFEDSKINLPLIMGQDLTGNIILKDMTRMPHLLIAGTTGSGKSVYVNSLISGLLFKLSKDELKFIMIDPKMVELELYNGIPHLLAPIITQPEEALAALEWAVREMDRRYKILADFGVRNVSDYNKEVKKINHTRFEADEAPFEKLPYIVIIIDEFANLMLRSPKETEKVISRIAAMARAVGIHLVIATQRPSVDVVTGIIKANFPSRISFRVISKTDSRTILDENGADSLLDKGDMLFRTPEQRDIRRIQAPFVSNQDVGNIVAEVKQNGSPDYEIDFDELLSTSSADSDSGMMVDAQRDDLFPDALREAVSNGEISASYLQRKFRIGFNRASRIVEGMDQMGILAPSKGSSKPREVIISQEDLVHYL